ncbi:MAG: FAD-binding protein, partial [Betaproteobacteria bacterium]
MPHTAKKEALAARLRQGAGPVGLAKDTSNLFRDRAGSARRRLDVRTFNEVLSIKDNTVDAEGMISYEALVRACLAQGVMPAVVPQLKTITLGGAVAGVGIESSSHRHGLVHDTMLELEVLLGDGRIVTATADNEHAELFFGFPNSYGTLGYALRVKAKTIPVKPYVCLEHIGFSSADAFFRSLESQLVSQNADFIDGTIFDPRRLYLTLGRFAGSAPYASDYTFEKIYYRSIAEKREDYLSIHDYLWRWDTDWFWCSKNVFAQNPLIRRIYGKRRLGSRTYTKIMRWNARVGASRKLERLLGLHSESVIQDVDIPLG